MIDIFQLPRDRWHELKTLRLEALNTEARAFSSSYDEEADFTKEMWQNRMNNILFALADDIPVGMIRYSFETSKKTQHIANIHSLYVNNKYRNQGIGTKLISGVISKITEKKEILKVKLTVNPLQESAVKLYRKYGFDSVGVCKNELHVDGKFYDEMIMEKYL